MLNIDYDFTQLPKRNLDYFIPMDLQPDPAEYATAVNTTVPRAIASQGHKKTGHYGSAGNMADWTQTLAICNKFLNPIGLASRYVTVFVSNKNQTAWNVHKDGYFTNDDRLNNTISSLEARISFYGLSTAPGAIRWWSEDDVKINLEVNSGLMTGPRRAKGNADFVEDLQQGKISWNEIPAPAFSSVTTCPGALVRTNLAHHVIQGDGFRYVVGFTITFDDGNPVGVWDHIIKNIDQLAV
jgi:hypothetical protein